MRNPEDWRIASIRRYRKYEEKLLGKAGERVERHNRIQLLLEDGASHGEVARTLHVSSDYLGKHFPGYRWTSSEGGKYGHMMQKMEKYLK